MSATGPKLNLKDQSKIKEDKQGVRNSSKLQDHYISLKDLDRLRTILLDQKTQLIEEANRTVDHLQSNAENFSDTSDRATHEEEFSLELRTRGRDFQLIKKIEKALERIDNGDYGYCESCGREIGVERLKVRPTANLCIDCKTFDEIKARN